MIARSEDEFQLFQRLDDELEWPGPLLGADEIPAHLRYSKQQCTEVVALTQKKPARVGMLATAERRAAGLGPEPKKPKGRPKKVVTVAARNGGEAAAPSASEGAAAVSAATAATGPRPSESSGGILGISEAPEEQEGEGIVCRVFGFVFTADTCLLASCACDGVLCDCQPCAKCLLVHSVRVHALHACLHCIVCDINATQLASRDSSCKVQHSYRCNTCNTQTPTYLNCAVAPR